MDNLENCFTIYPIHINSNVSCGNGRKYSLQNSIENPVFRKIKSALSSLNVEFKEEASKIHPKESKEKGRFIVKNKNKRTEIIQSIVNSIKELRSKKDTVSEKNSNNFLNLKPKSKKKSKNN